MVALDDLLSKAEPQYLESIALALAAIDPALADLHYALGTADGVALIYQNLNVNERLALKTIVFSAGERGAESTAIWQAINRSEGTGLADGRLSCERLRTLGLIFESLAVNGRIRYWVAQETFQATIKLVCADAAAQLTPVGADGLTEVESYPYALVLDTVHYLAYLAGNSVPLTQNGDLWKKDQSRIERGFLIREWFKNGAPYRPEFPGRMAFISAFCEASGLSFSGDSSLRVYSGAQVWVQQPFLELAKDVFRFWRVWLFPRLGQVDPLFKLLEVLPDGTWFGADQIAAQILPFIAGEVRQDNPMVSFNGFFRTALNLGIVDAGYRDRIAVYAVTKLGKWLIAATNVRAEAANVKAEADNVKAEVAEADIEIRLESRIYPQPSFEILAPKEIEPAVLWMLGLFCDLQQIDGFRTYRLTRESVHRGLNWVGIQDFIVLAGRCGPGLPNNVQFTLKDWAAGFGKAALIPGMLLRCEDAELAQAIYYAPRLVNSGVERLNETDLLIPPASRTLLDQTLADLGITLKQPKALTSQSQDGAVGTGAGTGTGGGTGTGNPAPVLDDSDAE